MGGRGPRRPLTAGTMAMLALTALVVVGCVGFFALIGGGDLHARALDVLASLGEDAPAVTPAPAPTATAQVAFATVTPEPVVVTPSPQPQPVTFTLAAAGTVYAPKSIRESVQEDAEHYDFGAVFEGLGTALSDADLSIVTLETTTAGRAAGYGNYNTPPEILDALRDAGADLVSLATERALDKGPEGLELTAGELTSRALAYVGVNPGGASVPVTMMRVSGVQAAVLAYTYGLSEEGAQAGAGAEASVAMLNMEQVKRDIQQARIAGANVVIVLPHWGTKNKADVQESLRQDARELAEAGADIILGTHPNVAQATERLTVTRSDGLAYDCVVCYSLGTLLGDARTPENTAGMIARLTVTYDPATRRTTLGDLACLPVYIAQQREDGRTVYRVVDVENAAAMERLTASEQEAARQAAQIIRDVTGQDEQEGQG